MIAYEKLVEDFEFLEDWEDKYRYVIEIGRDLEDMPDSDKTDENKVQGCVSQVWLTYDVDKSDPEDPVIRFKGDSDAHIVRGLVAIMLSAYSGKRASEIVKLDENEIFLRLGLIENLTPQRANGLRAMVKRIKQEAAKVAA
ncbi:SufE family protein [Hoeflea sp. CAU 1731]